MTIYFDMDGTIADLYGVENWLDYLINEDTFPYSAADPLVDVVRLKTAIDLLHDKGYTVGIISWTARGGSAEYNRAIRKAKKAWINNYFAGSFDVIHIVKYGTPKAKFATEMDWLFDDEEQNRANWIGQAFSETEIFEIIEG